ncbi:putative HTH-type transcriptional regulator YmfC [Acrocarpospora corrugata]|uniref:Putative HTH-type transcriptional regulator YmfC n=2 Tax=Acrocarpospora corrugata TaxID=35763 RepID=A0A5M3VXX2_9ACTN|nr:putative HTH-type transcriptional regulator YmfC [Acrocarpospora corrugata]
MGVSRTSLREAVQQLELDGLLIRRHGHGTFVRSSPLLQSGLNVNQSASQLIRAHGMVPGTRNQTVRPATLSAHEAGRLAMKPDDPIVVLERVRTADGRNVVFTRDLIPPALLAAAGVEMAELLDENMSLYHFYAVRLGVSVIDGTAWIRPDLAGKAIAEMLGTAPGTEMLVIEQLDRDAGEKPVLLSREHYVADAFEFVIHRRGPALSGRPQLPDR